MDGYITSGYRAGLFDGEAGLNWLRPAWRGLRLYARKARHAIEQGDMVHKADMILRADKLLTLLTGILGTGQGATLGPALMDIYSALRANLLRANLSNDLDALNDFESALLVLEREMAPISESALAA